MTRLKSRSTQTRSSVLEVKLGTAYDASHGAVISQHAASGVLGRAHIRHLLHKVLEECLAIRCLLVRFKRLGVGKQMTDECNVRHLHPISYISCLLCNWQLGRHRTLMYWPRPDWWSEMLQQAESLAITASAAGSAHVQSLHKERSVQAVAHRRLGAMVPKVVADADVAMHVRQEERRPQLGVRLVHLGVVLHQRAARR